MARPTKLTPEIQQKIIDTIRAGNYIETASAYAGINKSTLYDWMKRGAREKDRVAGTNRKIRNAELPYVEFSNAIEKALAESEVRDVIVIGNAAKENWQAAAWRLERKFPDRWGRKDKVSAQVEHSGEVTNKEEYHLKVEQVLQDDSSREQIRDVVRHAIRKK